MQREKTLKSATHWIHVRTVEHEGWHKLISGTGTASVQYYQIPGTDVVLLDTPGFDDPGMTDTEILTMISTCLEDSFNDEAEILGALYIHAIIEPRMKRSGVTNLLMFKQIIGMD
jgi:hypothetical protein